VLNAYWFTCVQNRDIASITFRNLASSIIRLFLHQHHVVQLCVRQRLRPILSARVMPALTFWIWPSKTYWNICRSYWNLKKGRLFLSLTINIYIVWPKKSWTIISVWLPRKRNRNETQSVQQVSTAVRLANSKSNHCIKNWQWVRLLYRMCSRCKSSYISGVYDVNVHLDTKLHKTNEVKTHTYKWRRSSLWNRSRPTPSQKQRYTLYSLWLSMTSRCLQTTISPTWWR